MAHKYAVSIHWTDSEDTGTDEFLTLEEVANFISFELSCVGKIPDYPEGIYPDEILITEVTHV